MFLSFSPHKADQPGRKKSTVVGKLQERRNTVVGRRQSMLAERRQSQVYDDAQRNSITPSTSSIVESPQRMYTKKDSQRSTSFKEKPTNVSIEMKDY